MHGLPLQIRIDLSRAVVGFRQTKMEVLESDDSYHVEVAVLKGLVNFAYFHTTAVPGSAGI